MTQIAGFLQEIKGKSTKFGTYYSLVVNGKEYETGSKFPPKGVAANDYVEFQLAPNARGYETIVQGSLSKKDAPAGVTAASAPTAQAGGMDRQEIISRQAALNSAMQMVSMLVAAGAIPEGSKTNAAQKVEKLEAMVMSYTARFYHYSTGNEYELPDDEVVGDATNWAEAE